MATATFFEIPTTPTAQQFSITLNGISYIMRLIYRDTDMGGWVLDIADSNNTSLACGIPLVTGCNLLDQYEYLGLGGVMIVTTDGDTLTPPTFENLGTTGHLWFGIRSS
jgi:hypothetical protein